MEKTYDKNKELLKRCAAGDKDAENQLLSDNFGLIKSISLKFTGRGTELEDIMQIASIGMIKAIRGFDEKYGCAFSTYAVPLITGEIRRFLRDDGLIKVGRDIKKNSYALLKAKQEYLLKTGLEPSLSTLCEICSLSPEDALLALNATTPAISLQEKISEDSEKEIGEFFKETDSIFDCVERVALSEAIKKLPEDERKLLSLRYFKGLTQSKTAQILGITQVKVSRLEKKIIDKLRLDFL